MARIEREQVLVESRDQWRAWLAQNHATSPGIWLVRWPKGAGPQLEAAGLMAPAGAAVAAVVAAARADGTWTALDAVPAARRHWDAFPRSARRGILEWILDTRTDSTRAKRIRETVDSAAQDVRANQWRGPRGRGADAAKPG